MNGSLCAAREARMLVFDPTLWGGRDQGDNSQFWKPAVVLFEYVDGEGRVLADVRFDHDGRVSKGHFADSMKAIRTTPTSSPLFPDAATLGELRELTADLPDETPIVVVTRKAHDPDHFYETVPAESDPHVDLIDGVVVLTAPEPRDFGD